MTLPIPTLPIQQLESFSQSLTHLAPALTNHLWQSTLFTCAAALLSLALRRNQARIRHWLWIAASLKFLIPCALLTALGTQLAALRPTPPAPTPLYSRISAVSEPFPVLAEPQVDITLPHFIPAPHLDILPLALAALWLVGLLVVLTIWLLYWLRIRSAIHNATELTHGREHTALHRLEAASHASTPICILETQTSLGPGIYGIRRPILLWPAGVSSRLTDAHLESVLAHEITHVLRRDNLTAAFHMVVEALFWFHPIAWWLGSRLESERERACDEQVLSLTDRPHTYAESILKICEFYTESPLPCVSGITASDLKFRIASILADHAVIRLTLPRKLLLSASAALALAIPIFLGAQSIGTLSVGDWAKAAGGRQEFAAAAIRLNKLGIPPDGPPPQTNVDLDPGDLYAPTGGTLRVQNKSLRTLIAFAYKMNGNQQLYLKEHVPDFVLSDRFDMQAKSDNPTPTKDQMRLMVRSVLEDRFKLKVHTESIQVPVLGLTLAHAGKYGPQLRLHKANDPVCADKDAALRNDGQLAPDGFPSGCGTIQLLGHAPGHLSQRLGGRNVPISLLAEALVAPYTGDTGLSRPVMDTSGIHGNIDFTLELNYTEMEPTNTPNTAPEFLEELSDQLGLKLTPTKGPQDFYVVDHVERLSNDAAQYAAPPSKPDRTTHASFVSVGFSRKQSAATPKLDRLEFDVASIRQNKSGDTKSYTNVPLGGDTYASTGGSFSATNQLLINYLALAYNLNGNQYQSLLHQLPDWATKERFDIQAKTDKHDVTKDEMSQMMRSLLADRFKLAVHNESQQMPVLAMELTKVGKASPSLRTHVADASCTNVPDRLQTSDAKPTPPRIGDDGFPITCGGLVLLPSSTPGLRRVGARNVSLTQLATVLQSWGKLGRPVIDRTGLSGMFDYILEWAPDSSTLSDSAKSSSPELGPTFLEALKEQLGLKLESEKGSIDVLVIDHLDHPTEN